ncbi:MAG: site-specific tyrosine recombinase/integron integrase [Flavobacteriaceae bacterium]
MCPNIQNILAEFDAKLRLQRYAPASIKTYKNALAKFLLHFMHQDLELLSVPKITRYLSSLQQKENMSPPYQRQILAAITKFYQLHYNRQLDLSVLYPKRKAKTLPKYLTPEEVRRLLGTCKNLKHLCVLKILYGCGLLVSEVITLKIVDIDSSAMRILVRNAKGKKDRVVPLPKSLLVDLRAYYKAFRPKNYLFEGQNGGQYSVKSIQQLTKKYAREALIMKEVTPHKLRHSYATHQLENGVNIRHIQELQGHNSIKTTEIYTHICQVSNANIANPLDQL